MMRVYRATKQRVETAAESLLVECFPTETGVTHMDRRKKGLEHQESPIGAKKRRVRREHTAVVAVDKEEEEGKSIKVRLDSWSCRVTDKICPSSLVSPPR